MYSNQAKVVGKEARRWVKDRGLWTGVWSLVDYSLCSVSYKLSANLAFSLKKVVLLLFGQVIICGGHWPQMSSENFAYLSRTHQVRSWSQCWLHSFFTLALFLSSAVRWRGRPFLPKQRATEALSLSSARSPVKRSIKIHGVSYSHITPLSSRSPLRLLTNTAECVLDDEETVYPDFERFSRFVQSGNFTTTSNKFERIKVSDSILPILYLFRL